MRSFITGSRAYGIPRENSDLDLCCLVSEKDYSMLLAFGTKQGNLNLILFNDDDPEAAKRFYIWESVNKDLIACAPVTREQAVLAFQSSGAAIENDECSGNPDPILAEPAKKQEGV